MEPEKQTNKQEKQTTDTEDKQMVARGAGSGSGEKKKVTEVIMHAKPLDCGDHFKMYIYMTPSHVYLNHIQLLSTKLKKDFKN